MAGTLLAGAWLLLAGAWLPACSGRVVGVSPALTVTAGTSLVLDCRLDAPPRPGLVWQREGRTVQAYLGHGAEAVGGGAEWVWRLLLDKVEESQSGEYTCLLEGGETEGGTEDRVESVARTRVTVLPDTGPHCARYEIGRQCGGSVRLECSDLQAGPDLPDWVAPHSNSSKTGLHPLIRVDREDSGVFLCSVGVEAGQVNRSGRVAGRPLVLDTANAAQAPGWPARLSCTVAGLPVPAVRWTGPTGAAVVSGAGVAVSLSSYSDGQLTSSLALDRVRVQQYGNYTCTAANRHGEEAAQLELRYSAQPVFGRGPAPLHLLRSMLLLVVLINIPVQ